MGREVEFVVFRGGKEMWLVLLCRRCYLLIEMICTVRSCVSSLFNLHGFMIDL